MKSISRIALLTLGLYAPIAQPAVDTWESTGGPFAAGAGNRVIHALAVSPNGKTVYAGTGSGMVFSYVVGDKTPDAFSFTDQTDVPLSSLRTSDAITVSGIDTGVTISITGGEYEVNAGGTWTSADGTVSNGDTVRVRHTSSASYLTTVDTSLTIGDVSDTFSSTTLPEYGACGSAQGVASAIAPSGANLCSAGTASAVVSASGGYTWTCTADTTANCAAPWVSTGNGGTGSVMATGGGSGTWSFASVEFIPLGGLAPPTGWTFPHGLLDFVLTGGDPGSTAQISITYSSPLPANAQYWKFGPTGDDNNPHWYMLPGSQVSWSPDRKTVTLSITDGGLGDDDLTAYGTIIDQGGAGVPVDPSAIPTLSGWGMALLSGLLALVAVGMRRRVGRG